MVGCESGTQSHSKIKFYRGMYVYSYFNNNNSVWVAPTDAAVLTKTEWDYNIRGYLEKECMDWLSRFMESGKMQLKDASMYDRKLFLFCIFLFIIIRDNRSRKDGVMEVIVN